LRRAIDRQSAFDKCEHEPYILHATFRPGARQSLIAEAVADEEAARQAMMASNPIGQHRFTSIDSITNFSDNQTRYAKLKAYREQLSVLWAS
jgi:hypothetical protein